MKLSKHMKMVSIIVSVISIIVLSYLLVISSEINKVVNTRDTSLDFREATKLWVMEDIRDYLMVSDVESYNSARGMAHLSSEVMDDLYGSSYDSRDFMGANSVSFVDAQYNLERDNLIIYLLANVYTGDEYKEINFMVFVRGNIIVDVIAY